MAALPSADQSRQIIDGVARLYHLQPIAYLEPSKGYRNHSLAFRTTERVFNVMLFKDDSDVESTINRANQIGDYLAAAGFLARRTVDGRLLRVGRRLACLYVYQLGKTIPWEAYTRRHLRALGTAMGQMHQLLQECPVALPTAAGRLEIYHKAMISYFQDFGVVKALQNKLGLKIDSAQISRLSAVIKAISSAPSQQPLHLDFVRGNILFSTASEPEITGVLDFEKVASGHPLIDVARTLAFLVVDCRYQPPSKVQYEFLGNGYLKVRPDLTIGLNDPRAALTSLVNLFLFYDLYKFLRHNPYESLPSNHHYRRTVKLMLFKGLITQSVVASTL